jgi:peptidoglycan/LPS O-acetylase OafA/YrhL
MRAAAIDRRRPGRPRRPALRHRRITALLAFEAATLAVFAALHLSGALRIGSSSSKPSYGAGFAEALICVALAAGAWMWARSPRGRGRGRGAALAGVGFAIVGFLVGLSFTLGSGDTIDLTYHVVMLPALVATAVLLARQHPGRRPPAAPDVKRPKAPRPAPADGA